MSSGAAEPALVPRLPGRAVAPLLAVLALALLGLLLVGSGANTPAARRWGRPPSDTLLRQAGALAGGLVLLGVTAGLGAAARRLAWPLALGFLALSGLTLVPGVGVPSGGAWRQVELGGVGLQPTVFLAAVVPLLLARAWSGRLASYLALGVLAAGGAVCLCQPNFGHLGTLLAAALGALWGFGPAAQRARRRLGACGLALLPVAACFPYVRWRLQSFLHPGLTRDTQALELIRRGAGALGTGLGQGQEKALLSAAPTDYLFAVTLEELGWVGAAGVLSLLALLCLGTWRLGPSRPGPGRALAGGPRPSCSSRP